jgi:hypothetical protein
MRLPRLARAQKTDELLMKIKSNVKAGPHTSYAAGKYG